MYIQFIRNFEIKSYYKKSFLKPNIITIQITSDRRRGFRKCSTKLRHEICNGFVSSLKQQRNFSQRTYLRAQIIVVTIKTKMTPISISNISISESRNHRSIDPFYCRSFTLNDHITTTKHELGRGLVKEIQCSLVQSKVTFTF